MRKITCIIADDEPLALQLVESFVQRVPFLELKAKFVNAWEVGEFLETQAVDLLYLDIEMPGLDSITLLKSLKTIPAVIFITAHRNFAVDAFELNATDYLLKPISFERFLAATNKVKEAHHKPHTDKVSTSQNITKDHIFILSERKMIKVLFDDIKYIEARGDYLKFVTEEGKSILTKMTLKQCVESLPEEIFSQIHRSFIINRNKVKAYTQESVQIGEEWLKISRAFKNIFN